MYIKPPASSVIAWQSAMTSPPKESGWYPCSIRRNPVALRWFDKDKNFWSEFCPIHNGSEYAAHMATLPAKKAISRLFWSSPWW